MARRAVDDPGVGAGAGASGRGDSGDAVFGVLGAFVRDPAVTDVFVNPGGAVWVDRGAGAEAAGVVIPAAEARDLATRLIAAGERHVDEATPAVDVRLGDGMRVSPRGAVLSIRLPRRRPFSLDELEAAGFFTSVAEGAAAVRDPRPQIRRALRPISIT